MRAELSTDFPQRIRRLRERFDLTQARLAQLLGVSVTSIIRWEQGQTRPSSLAWGQITRAEAEGGGALGLDPYPSPTESPLEQPPADSASSPPTNLPVPVTSFVGRRRELAELRGQLAQTRLLTITGPGGSGKTRLALEAVTIPTPDPPQAEHPTPDFADGVWLVELEGIANGAFVPQAVAAALGVREQRGRPLLDSLLTFLRQRRLLLVLDNCEHVIADCAALVARLLSTCPSVSILATSREPLGIAGETTWQIPPLSLPGGGDRGQGTGNREQGTGNAPQSSFESSSEAVQLFAERARAVQPDFMVDAQNRRTIEQICLRLDGIPLALELAAARVRVLSVEQILTRLEDRFRLLVGGSRTAPLRQQTLRAAVDWSYDLLTEPEQTLFRRLSVFARSFRLEAAEAIGRTEDSGLRTQALVPSSSESLVLSPQSSEVLELLSRLVEKSLVVMEPVAGAARYRLLETLREYGRERLAESGEADAVRRRYTRSCLSLAEAAETKLNGADQGIWIEQLEEEYDDLRAALAWCLGAGDDAETGLRLAGALALSGFWMRRGYLSEGRAWCNDVLKLGGRRWPRQRAKILTGAGTLARHQGDFADARALAEQSLEIWQELDDPPGIARALSNLGNLAVIQGDLDRARELQEEALRLARESGNPASIAGALESLAQVLRVQGELTTARAVLNECLQLRRAAGNRGGIAAVLSSLGLVARDSGDYAGARRLFEESLAVARDLRLDWGIATVLANLGAIASREGRVEDASDHYRESLQVRWRLGDKPGVAECFAGLARVSAAQERLDEAVRLLAAMRELLAELSSPLPTSYEEDAAQALAQSQAGLPAAEFATSWTIGQALPLEQIVGAALMPAPIAAAGDNEPDGATLAGASRSGARAHESDSIITRREVEVLRLIAAGWTNQQIADELIVSVRTVENHIANLYAKIGVHSRGQAIAYALQHDAALRLQPARERQR